MTGSGDIAPSSAGRPERGPGITVRDYLVGAFAGLIAVAVVAAMFVTAEYRRGLIRVTLAASPRRGRVLAAKAIVIGAVAFAAGLVAAAIAVLVGQEVAARQRRLRVPGAVARPRCASSRAPRRCWRSPPCSPSPSAPCVRRSAVAVTIVIVAIVLPVPVRSAPPVLPAGPPTGCCGSPGRRASPSSSPIPKYPQVRQRAPPSAGYYPLAPWAGFAVLCAWTRGPGRRWPCAGTRVPALRPDGTRDRSLRYDACAPSGPSCAPCPGTGLAAAGASSR